METQKQANNVVRNKMRIKYLIFLVLVLSLSFILTFYRKESKFFGKDTKAQKATVNQALPHIKNPGNDKSSCKLLDELLTNLNNTDEDGIKKDFDSICRGIRSILNPALLNLLIRELSNGKQKPIIKALILRSLRNIRDNELINLVEKFLLNRCHGDQDLLSECLHYIQENRLVQMSDLLTKLFFDSSQDKDTKKTILETIGTLGNLEFIRSQYKTTVLENNKLDNDIAYVRAAACSKSNEAISFLKEIYNSYDHPQNLVFDIFFLSALSKIATREAYNEALRYISPAYLMSHPEPDIIISNFVRSLRSFIYLDTKQVLDDLSRNHANPVVRHHALNELNKDTDKQSALRKHITMIDEFLLIDKAKGIDYTAIEIQAELKEAVKLILEIKKYKEADQDLMAKKLMEYAQYNISGAIFPDHQFSAYAIIMLKDVKTEDTSIDHFLRGIISSQQYNTFSRENALTALYIRNKLRGQILSIYPEIQHYLNSASDLRVNAFSLIADIYLETKDPNILITLNEFLKTEADSYKRELMQETLQAVTR